MYDTTFPGYPGAPSSTSETRQFAPTGGYEKKPWQSGEKKPWSGGGEKKPFTRKPETDFTVYKPYACTANQNAPEAIQAKFVEFVKRLEKLDYTLRTGGMDGIEDLVEKSVEKKEVILPFQDFNHKQSKFTYVSERAKAVAKMFFPSYDTVKKGAQYFLAKNARLVLGNDMKSPSLFLLVWTEDGIESIRDRTNRTGFSGHPIAIASSIGIPIFNLGNPTAEQRLSMYLDSLIPPSV